MDNYEQQQWIQIQQWFKQNAVYLIAFLVLTIGGTGGWKYWQNSQFEHKSTASELYEEVIVLSTEGNIAEAKNLLEQLAQDYLDTAYPFLANLQLAKQAFLHDDLATAKESLRWVSTYAEDENIIYIAAERLTRLHISENETVEAVEAVNEALGKIANQSSISNLNMLLGDAYLKQNNPALAKTAYQTAKSNLPPNSSLKELIEMKLRDIASL